MSKLTHIDGDGAAHMVEVGDKADTVREARAEGRIRMKLETVEAIRTNAIKKGDVLATARIAGIMAAKRTPDLIPLCHVVSLSGVEVEVDVDVDAGRCRITATATAADRTGVEMEALVAASTTALTLYDMTKAVERGAVVEHVRLESKTGGVRGDWHRGGAV